MGAIYGTLDSFQTAEKQLAQGANTSPEQGTPPDSTPLPGSSEAAPADPQHDPRLMEYLEGVNAPQDIQDLAATGTVSNKKFTQSMQDKSQQISEGKEQIRYLQGQLSAQQSAPAPAVAGESTQTNRERLLEQGFPGDEPANVAARKMMGEMFDDVQKETMEATMRAMQPTQAAVAASNIRAAEAEYKAEAVKHYGPGVHKYWDKMWGSTLEGVQVGMTPDPERWLTRNHWDESLEMATAARQESVNGRPVNLESHARPAQGASPISRSIADGDPERGEPRKKEPVTRESIMREVDANMRLKYPDNPMWRD